MGLSAIGGIEPQPVALLAVVERCLEGRRRDGACGPRRRVVRVGAVVALARCRPPRLPPRRLGGAGSGLLELGGDLGVVFGAQIDLIVEVERRRRGLVDGVVGRKLVLALELLDLLDGHLQLMRDPRVGPALANPAADLVEMRAQ